MHAVSCSLGIRMALLALVSTTWLACASRTLPIDPIDGGGAADLAADLLRPSGLFTDFPATPIIDSSGGSVPANSGDLFGTAEGGAASGGPCLTDPEIGALFPRNWLRLRFRFTAPAGQNLFEIRLHAPNQANDLVVYTAANQWIMPADLWSKLSVHSVDMPLTVSIRGATLRGSALSGMPALGSRGDITIAPVNANGSIVYWTSSGGTMLRGFQVGEEKVHDVLTPAQVGGGITCIGCHNSTPDGEFIGFEQVPYNSTSVANVSFRSADGKATPPTFLSPAAWALIGRMSQVEPFFSPGHWRAGDRIMMVMAAIGGPYGLNWIDLEAPSTDEGKGWGVIARMGDGQEPGRAVWSRSGKTIAYVHGSDSAGDIYTVPYNDRQGGIATPLSGASDPSWNEFYPAYAPDDALLAFDRVPIGQPSYNDAASELFVIPESGGVPVRLDANDPPACSGRTSPGLTNSWPRWSPEALMSGGRKYYWIAFSSTRAGGNPQLHLTGVVVTDGVIKTYKAIYPWNQPATENNHTAAWDVFKIIIG